MKKEIVVRCITEYSKGFGNLNRCLILAEGLERKGYKTIFLIDRKASAINEIKKKNFNYKIFKKYSGSKEEASAITNFMLSNNHSSIIIDMREYSESLTKNLMNKNFGVIMIDDAWCKKAYADLIINGTIVKKYHNYKKINQQSRIFIGPKYFLTHPEFKKYKKKLSDIKEKKRFNVVISMGGSDSNQLSLKIAKSILKIPYLRIKIIIGPFFKNSKKLYNFAKNNKRIITKSSPRAIWKDFNKADIVIVAAGSTLFELALQQVPSICIATTKHQIPYAKQFAQYGFAKNLGYLKDISYSKLNNILEAILANTNQRKQMCLEGGKILDGYGLQRITKIINTSIKGN